MDYIIYSHAAGKERKHSKGESWAAAAGASIATPERPDHLVVFAEPHSEENERLSNSQNS